MMRMSMSGDAARRAMELVEKGHDIVVATIVKTQGSAPRHTGTIMVFARDGRQWGTIGGGAVEAALTHCVAESFADKMRERTVHYDLRLAGDDALDMVCGGSVDILVEFFEGGKPEALRLCPEVPDTAYIFGAGHVGAALEPLLRFVGFQTVVVDDRSECADPALFPQAHHVLAVDSYEHALSAVAPREGAYVIIVTSTYTSDHAVLRDALAANCAYIGMMGSSKKIAFIFNALRDEGVSDEALEKVYAPIGEHILAETPEELAVSIAGELIRVRAGYKTR